MPDFKKSVFLRNNTMFFLTLPMLSPAQDELIIYFPHIQKVLKTEFGKKF